MAILGGSGGAALFSLFAPLLAALPFADTYRGDVQNGYIWNVLARTAKGQYIRAKLMANGLAGGLAISMPMLFSLVLACALYPVQGPVEPVPGAFQQLVNVSWVVYALVLCVTGFLFGSAWATLGLALSTLIRNRYLVLGAPFLVYTFLTFFSAIIGVYLGFGWIQIFEPPGTLAPFHIGNSTWWSVLGENGLILAASTWFFMKQTVDREVLDEQ